MERTAALRVAILALVVLMLAPAAMAEGSWTSSITNALTGFDSRSWTDNNSDSANTTIQFNNCEDDWTAIEPDNTQIQLTKETPWYEPDENRGRFVSDCENSDTDNWGDEPSGSYHFTIIRINGSESSGRLDVPFLRVRY